MASPQRRPGNNPLPLQDKPAAGTPAHNPAPAPAPATTAARPISATRPGLSTKPAPVFLFDRSNYYWMLGGLALIILGFLLISGGKSLDPTKFNYEEIYSFRRITLAPLLMLAGFGIEVYAIMKRPRTATDASYKEPLA